MRHQKDYNFYDSWNTTEKKIKKCWESPTQNNMIEKGFVSRIGKQKKREKERKKDRWIERKEKRHTNNFFQMVFKWVYDL